MTATPPLPGAANPESSGRKFVKTAMTGSSGGRRRRRCLPGRAPRRGMAACPENTRMNLSFMKKKKLKRRGYISRHRFSVIGNNPFPRLYFYQRGFRVNETIELMKP